MLDVPRLIPTNTILAVLSGAGMLEALVKLVAMHCVLSEIISLVPLSARARMSII